MAGAIHIEKESCKSVPKEITYDDIVRTQNSHFKETDMTSHDLLTAAGSQKQCAALVTVVKPLKEVKWYGIIC